MFCYYILSLWKDGYESVSGIIGAVWSSFSPFNIMSRVIRLTCDCYYLCLDVLYVYKDRSIPFYNPCDILTVMQAPSS